MEMAPLVDNVEPVQDPFVISEAAEYAIKKSGIKPLAQAVTLFPEKNVTTHITVANRTNHALIKPMTYINKGEIPILPQNINPGTRGSMVATNTGWTISGSCGIVTWLIHAEGQNVVKRLIIMWHNPWNRLFFNNWLGLGEANDTVDINLEVLYKALYNNNKTRDLDFEISKFCWQPDALCFDKGTQVIVEGMMGTGRKSNINIVVSPKLTRNYSRDIFDYIKENENN